MKILKNTKCLLSELGHYNVYYMSKNVAEFNVDCEVEVKPYINGENRNFIAIQTESKNIGLLEESSNDLNSIIVWIERK